MPLNEKRRIFRPVGLSAPSSGLAVAAGCLLAAVALTAWLTTPASDAPAHQQPTRQIVADGARVLVIDNATLRLGDQVLRLERVEPIGRGTICAARSGSAGDCGDLAASALAERIGGRPVECEARSAPDGGRPLAICRVDGRPLNPLP